MSRKLLVHLVVLFLVNCAKGQGELDHHQTSPFHEMRIEAGRQSIPILDSATNEADLVFDASGEFFSPSVEVPFPPIPSPVPLTPEPGLPLYVLGNEAEYTVEAKVGKRITFQLEGNPTTGYTWDIDEVATSPSLQFGKFEAVRRRRPTFLCGVPSDFTLKVVPTQPGEVILKMKYFRPWETGTDPIITKTIHTNATG